MPSLCTPTLTASPTLPTLTTIPKEIVSHIVKQDLAMYLSINRMATTPLSTWSRFDGIPRRMDHSIVSSVAHTWPQDRVDRQETRVCSHDEEMLEPILFTLSQTSHSLRVWLLSESSLWQSAILLKPLFAPWIASRAPEGAPLKFIRSGRLCPHAIRTVLPYLHRAGTIDFVVPAHFVDHPSRSMGVCLADSLGQASSLTSVSIQFDASAPTSHPAHHVLVMSSLREAILVNSSVVLVGPALTKLSLSSECNPGTQLYLDDLMSALQQCGQLQHLRLDSVLYQARQALPWELPSCLRRSRILLPHLSSIHIIGTHMDAPTVIYALQGPKCSLIHFDMGLPLASLRLPLEKHWLAWPMLAFSNPALARDLLDSAWLAYNNGGLWEGSEGDLSGVPEVDEPEVFEEVEDALLIGEESLPYPRQAADPRWFDFNVCAYVEQCFQPDFKPDELFGHDYTPNTCMGLGIGWKPRGAMRHIPDYVTLVAGLHIGDVRQHFNGQWTLMKSHDTHCHSLTVRHIPRSDDINLDDCAAHCMDLLIRSYASRCNVTAIGCFVLGNPTSHFESHLAWHALGRLPKLCRVVIEGSISWIAIGKLGSMLERRAQFCPQLTEVLLRDVTSLPIGWKGGVWHAIQQLGKMTRARPNLQWICTRSE